MTLVNSTLRGNVVYRPGGATGSTDGGGIYVYGGDPGPGVLLSPVGGVLLLAAVLLTAIRYRPSGN